MDLLFRVNDQMPLPFAWASMRVGESHCTGLMKVTEIAFHCPHTIFEEVYLCWRR